MAKATTISLAPRSVPVVADVDVVVVGGGTAGVPAAVAAARNGASTVLIDAFGALGGTISNGLMQGVFGFTRFMSREQRPICGLLGELMSRLSAFGAPVVKRERVGESLGGEFSSETLNHISQQSPEAVKWVYLEMVEEAGVQLLLHSVVADCVIENGSVRGIVVANKAGCQAIRSKVVIDTTGDADVAAIAGAPFQVGHPADGHSQAVTLIFKIGGLDESRLPRDRDWWAQALKKAGDKGELQLPRYVLEEETPYNVGTLMGARLPMEGVRTYNIDLIDGIDGSDPLELTRAQVECRKRIMAVVNFYRGSVPGGERCFLAETAPFIGVRDSRRITGDYVFTWEDFRSARKFEDTVAASVIPIDLHDGMLLYPDEPASRHLWKRDIPAPTPPRGDWYDIPYRMLLPRGVENVIVAGRCVSSDYYTQGAFRLIPNCVATAQAGGTAAALAAREGVSPRGLSVRRLQNALAEQGVDLATP